MLLYNGPIVPPETDEILVSGKSVFSDLWLLCILVLVQISCIDLWWETSDVTFSLLIYCSWKFVAHRAYLCSCTSSLVYSQQMAVTVQRQQRQHVKSLTLISTYKGHHHHCQHFRQTFIILASHLAHSPALYASHQHTAKPLTMKLNFSQQPRSTGVLIAFSHTLQVNLLACTSYND